MKNCDVLSCRLSAGQAGGQAEGDVQADAGAAAAGREMPPPNRRRAGQREAQAHRLHEQERRLHQSAGAGEGEVRCVCVLYVCACMSLCVCVVFANSGHAHKLHVRVLKIADNRFQLIKPPAEVTGIQAAFCDLKPRSTSPM